MKNLFRAICVLLALLSVVAVIGCSSKDPAEVSINIEDQGLRLFALSYFEDQMNIIDDDTVRSIIGDTDLITDCVAYAGESGATAEMFLLIYCENIENVPAVETMLKSFRDMQEESFSSYNPNEVPKLKSAVICARGHYVLYCVAKDSDMTLDGFKLLFK